MAFLSKKNADMLYEVVSEEFVNIDYGSFNKLFLEFGESVAQTQLPVMELNKRFVRTLQAQYQQQRHLQQSHQPQQQNQQQQAHPSSSIIPSRPQGARSKNVTFDQELELHKQHFQQFAAPPPPTPPVFKDTFEQPVDDLSLLMKKAMSERNYDTMPPPPPTRKLHIGSVVEDEKLKEDMIDIDKFLQQREGSSKRQPHPQPQQQHQPQPTKPSASAASSFDFFSKLKVVKPVIESQPDLPDEEEDNEEEKIIEDSVTNISTNALEELTQKVSILTEELQSMKELVVTLSTELKAVKHYIPELKETPTLQDK
jgi:hypothetical protein